MGHKSRLHKWGTFAIQKWGTIKNVPQWGAKEGHMHEKRGHMVIWKLVDGNKWVRINRLLQQFIQDKWAVAFFILYKCTLIKYNPPINWELGWLHFF